MTHLQFVTLAYAIAAMPLIGLTCWLLFNKNRLQKQRQRLEEQQATLQKTETRAEF